MEKVKKALSSRIGFAIILNLLTIVTVVLLFRPFWEETDDIGIAMLAEGVFGEHEPHVLFSNIIYGDILCFFQKLLPVVRWHAIFEYLFAFMISTVFVYVISRDRKGRIMALIFLLGSYYEVYVSAQFSKFPAFIAITGYMIFFELIHDTELDRQVRLVIVLITWACFFYAILLRSDAFLLATMIAGVFGLIRIGREIVERTLIPVLKNYFILFIPILIIWVVCSLIDHYRYSDEWNDFRSYQDNESMMIDYHYPALIYGDHKEELDSIGVSENDAFMFITWQFADDEYLTEDLIGKIIEIDLKDSKVIDQDMIKAWVANIYETICVINPTTLALMILVGLFVSNIFFGKNKIYKMLMLIGQIVLLTVVLFYYQYSGRWSHRVVFALMLAEFILFLYLLCEDADVIMSRGIAGCVMTVLLFALGTQRLGNELEYQNYKRTECVYSELISYMKQNKDKLFVADTFSMQGYDKYNVFRAADKGQFNNYVTVGGTYVNSPVTKSVTYSYGYSNPFKALEGRDDNVILIDNNCPERKVIYCNEHGDGGEYTLESFGDVGGLRLYKIR